MNYCIKCMEIALDDIGRYPHAEMAGGVKRTANLLTCAMNYMGGSLSIYALKETGFANFEEVDELYQQKACECGDCKL